MAPLRRFPWWEQLFQNLPPWPPREFAALLCHASGKLVGRRGLPVEMGSQRRWLNWLAAALAALGMLLLLSKLAAGDTPARRPLAATAAVGLV